MDQLLIIAVASDHLVSDGACARLLSKKSLFPLCGDDCFLGNETRVTVKFRRQDSTIAVDGDSRIVFAKGLCCLEAPVPRFEELFASAKLSDYVVVLVEGTGQEARLVFSFESGTDALFETFARENPTVRLASHDLPPARTTLLDVLTSGEVLKPLYAFMARRDAELLSVRTRLFLKNPHILTHLFSHVMSLKSRDHINYIASLRTIADQLRELLRPRIRSVARDHHELWGRYYGQRISFVDGGMSRIVSLPGAEPMGIRVGIYTAIPGEREPEKREQWTLSSHVIGDILSERGVIEQETYHPEVKRLQEAARYLLEPLSALDFVRREAEKPVVVFLHGPLQNAFEKYDELDPNYVPGVDREFLTSKGVSEAAVSDALGVLPTDAGGNSLWYACIPVYAYIMHQAFSSEVPFVGVVERSHSNALTSRVLYSLVEDGLVPESYRKKVWDRVRKQEISDEFLFGCILEEGEYLEPVALRKNLRRRAHDRWKQVVEHFPEPRATMLKCSADRFPFRVELTRVKCWSEADAIMSLLFHTSLLLPKYSFPVGIDIADKYAKIPDWLSRGVSSTLTASILTRVLETGDERLLRQVRQLLAKSPRDFFFRPKP